MLESCSELLGSLNNGKVFAERLGVILNIAEITLNLVRLRGSHTGELAEHPIGQVGLAAAIAKQSGEKGSKTARQEQHQDQLGLDAQLIQGSSGKIP